MSRALAVVAVVGLLLLAIVAAALLWLFATPAGHEARAELRCQLGDAASCGTRAAPPPAPPPAPPSHGALRLGAIKPPRKLKDVRPVLPKTLAPGADRRIVLEATISPAGTVTHVRVLKGTGPVVAPSIAAVKQWVYEPTVLNGVAVQVLMAVTVNVDTR